MNLFELLTYGLCDGNQQVNFLAADFAASYSVLGAWADAE